MTVHFHSSGGLAGVPWNATGCAAPSYPPPRQEHIQLGSQGPIAAAEGREGKKLGAGQLGEGDRVTEPELGIRQ